MARIEKTVFISYRRTDVYTALAAYENLKNQGYDVFFDYRSISSGDFEQIITGNIKARAHFLLILTPTALDRCNEPGDWLRREIEFAIDEKRNIIPLFFKGFRFGDPSVSEKLTGKLKNLSRYNGLNVHEDYFDEAMERLRTQYLNIPLTTVLHPVSTEVQRVVRAEQVAADKALEQIPDVKELAKQDQQKPIQSDAEPNLKRRASIFDFPGRREVAAFPGLDFNFRLVGGIAGVVLFLALLIWGSTKLFQNQSAINATPTSTSEITMTATQDPNLALIAVRTSVVETITADALTRATIATKTPFFCPPLTGTPNRPDNATLIADLTYPKDSPVLPGQSFEKKWLIQNTGLNTWTRGYVVAFGQFEQMGATSPLHFAQEVSSGECLEISITMTAPQSPGTHKGFWVLQADENLYSRFGLGPDNTDGLHVEIVVASPTQTP